MAKMKAESWDVDAVIDRLHVRKEFAHLRVRRRADLITIESGPNNDPIPHARMRRVAVSLWTLEMPSHIGRWEKTPFRALRDDIVDALIVDFGWTLQPMD